VTSSHFDFAINFVGVYCKVLFVKSVNKVKDDDLCVCKNMCVFIIISFLGGSQGLLQLLMCLAEPLSGFTLSSLFFFFLYLDDAFP